MSRSIIEYFNHIITELYFLRKASIGLDLDNFLQDDTLKRAFARSLEIIGEAVKAVPDEIRISNPQVEWKAMAGMRDKLIHHYFGVDYELVWDIIENQLEELTFQMENILEDLKKEK